MAKKKFALRPDQIKPLAPYHGACIATDMITVSGRKVGYMYREEPSELQDSGWVFTAGDESRAYMDDAKNHGLYDVNTIANYDPEIIPLLDAPYGVEFERVGGTGRFKQVAGEPWAPSTTPSTKGTKKWPPPGFPVVEGEHFLTTTWSIDLPERFARRIEDSQCVLWRPGLTIWLSAWNNDLGETRQKRLAALKKEVSPERFAEELEEGPNLTRYSYRLRDETEEGRVEALFGLVLSDAGHLQLAIYFDDVREEAVARRLVASVVDRESMDSE